VDAKSIGFLIFLLSWVLVLRAPTFLVSAIDWDEGLYVLIASQWLSGHPPYTTVFEIKPIGIFAIFAAALGAFGESIASIRLLTVAIVCLTSVVLLLIARRTLHSELAGLLAAISYPVLSLGLQGLSSNTELFFILFDVLGLLLLLLSTSNSGMERRKVSLYALAAGLSLGAAVQIKYIVGIEIVLFIAYFVLIRYRSLHHASMILAMVAIGGVLPTLVAVGYLWTQDVLDLFLASNFDANRRYVVASGGEDIWTGLMHSLEDWFKWVWVTVAAIIFLGIRARHIARYLKGQISPQDSIYVVNGQPIVYFLAKAQLPTRYVFPALIISEPISRVANVDYPGEVERILDKAPRAVLIRDDNEGNTRVNEIRARLQRDYVVGTRIADTVVYIRKPRDDR